MGKILKDLKEKATQSRTSTSPESTSQNTNNYKCEKCKDRGLYFIDNNTVRPCDCRETRKRERLLHGSQITEEFQSLSFANFQHRGAPDIISKMFTMAVKYRQDFPSIKDERSNSIAFLGQPGTGKTHLISAIANELIKEDLVEVVYFPYVEGFNAIKDDLEKLHRTIERLQTCEVLFIDDLYKGRDFPTGFVLEQLHAIINERYLNHRPTLISSEKTPDQLLDIDEAIGSRLLHMARGYTLEILGDRFELNYRLRAE